jgi:hypothetical protein
MYSICSIVFGIATTLRAGRFGDLVPVRARISFLSPKYLDRPWGQNRLLCNWYRGPLMRYSWWGPEFNISYPCSWEVNMSGATPLPMKPQYTIWTEVKEVLLLVITTLEAKTLLTTCRIMWHLCSKCGWFHSWCRRSSVEGTGVSCVHGVYGSTHKAV